MNGAGEVTVEFFGVPRLRSGRAELTLHAETVADLLAGIERMCPGLMGLVQKNGRLTPQYLLSMNGSRFVHDLRERLEPGNRLLLLSADAGG